MSRKKARSLGGSGLLLCFLFACPGPGTTTEVPGGGPSTSSSAPQGGCSEALKEEHAFYFDGGLTTFRDRATLSTSLRVQITRTFNDGTKTSCEVKLSCEAGDEQRARDIVSALEGPDVVSALSKHTILFGRDTRPIDRPIFTLERGGDRVQVGGECVGTREDCLTPPEGVVSMVKVLTGLYEDTKGQAACAGLAK